MAGTWGTCSLTVEEIIAKYPADWQKFKDNEDMATHNSPLFMALYEHWSANGEMPYGTMKARDGDPDQWIANKLEDYLYEKDGY